MGIADHAGILADHPLADEWLEAMGMPPREGVMPKPIHEHQGSKYIRVIRSAVPQSEHDYDSESAIIVDVYCVLEAFGVTCPARQHAIKKLLAAGLREKGSQLDDLIGAEAAISRAIELQQVREGLDAIEQERVEQEALREFRSKQAKAE